MKLNEIMLKDIQSGFMKSPDSVQGAQAVAQGQEPVTLSNGRTYKAVKNLTGLAIAAGQVVIARYNSFNQGVDICKILGVTDMETKYGDGGIKFKSVKEALMHYQVKTLKELEALGDEKEYGHGCYLYVEDMEDVEHQYKRGPWYYLDEGRWCRGSGAEKLSFSLMEEVPDEGGE